MTPAQIDEAATIPAAIAALGFIVATSVYGVGSPWHTSGLGRVMFGLFGSISLVFGIILGRRFFGAYEGYQTVAVVAYTILAVAAVALAITIIVERRAPTRSPLFPPKNRKVTSMADHESPNEESFVDKVGEYRKAIAAFVVPALVVLGAALLPDADGTVVVTLNEWVGIAIAALGTTTAVGLVKNDPYTG